MRKEVSWFKSSIIYHIFVDRFAGVKKTPNPLRSEFCGGNLNAITDKMNYFNNLGVNTIWLSPITEGVSYHGYHTTDFFSIDPHFGTQEDFNNLVSTAHNNDLKLMLDFVPNHVSNRHPFFVKARTNKNSRYRSWFYFKKDNSYLSFMGLDELPKLNLDNEDVRTYIISAARFWLDKGINGFRLDHVAGPSLNFWKYFVSEINKSHPKAVLIGEMWTDGWDFKHWKTLLGAKNKFAKLLTLKNNNDEFMRDYIDILDGCLDFSFNKIIRKYASNELNHKQAYSKLQKHYAKFPKGFFLPTFLDNHDMERILLIANQDQEILKQLASWQFKIKQPPIIYYGTEVAMTQEKYFSSLPSHGDLLARQPMKWENAGNDMFNFYKLLIAQKNRRERKDKTKLTKDQREQFLLD